MIHPEILDEARKAIGMYLKQIRTEKELSKYAGMKATGLKFEQITAMEEGTANYTVNSLLIYATFLECRIFFDEKK